MYVRGEVKQAFAGWQAAMCGWGGARMGFALSSASRARYGAGHVLPRDANAPAVGGNLP